MRDHEHQIHARGAGIAAIGTGDLMYAEDFAATRDVAFPLMVDDDLRSYKAVGTRKGSKLGMVSASTLVAGARATARGHVNGKRGRHALALGATHVIRPDGGIPLAWINDDYGDNPPLRMVLDALDGSRNSQE